MCEESQESRYAQEPVQQTQAPAAQPEPHATRPAPVPVVAVVLAAGFGTRFDVRNPKQLVAVANKPVVCWSIEAFEYNPRITDIIVVTNPQVRGEVERLVDEAGYEKVQIGRASCRERV